MADRSLRGSRLGSQSFQSEDGVDFAARSVARYRADDGSVFEVTFAEDAEAPPTWVSARTGLSGVLLDTEGEPVEQEESDARPVRTHWDMLLERRSIAELEELLQERLTIMRAQRGEQRKSA